MTYACEISTGQWIYLENVGNDTVITLAARTVGQQQQSTSRWQSGAWIQEPALFQTGIGVIIRLTIATGEQYFQVQGSQIALMAGAPSIEMRSLPLQSSPDSPQSPLPPIAPMTPMMPMTPMSPMPPMQMGNMEMSLNPMHMRMGDMAMSLGDPAQATSAKRQFCSQCGQPVTPEDRFCSHCGHQLQSS
ncbi:MAG TPA: zinc ribbon domain-containing protein [Trichocoleus sp.]